MVSFPKIKKKHKDRQESRTINIKDILKTYSPFNEIKEQTLNNILQDASLYELNID